MFRARQEWLCFVLYIRVDKEAYFNRSEIYNLIVPVNIS